MRASPIKWVGISGVVALGLLVAGYATLVEPRRPRLTERIVKLPGLPRKLDGLTILHLSDLHVTGYDNVLYRFLERLSHAEPDIVAITGDLCGTMAGIEACAEMLGLLKGRYGEYVVLGNHDHYKYPTWSALLGVFKFRKPVPTGMIVRAVESYGIKVLINESRCMEIGGELVYLAGIDDMFSEEDDLPKAVADMDETAFKILLSHSPDVLEDASALGFHLVLAGHTHGGQVRLPFIGALTTHTRKPVRPAAGMVYRTSTPMHVSQGLGTTGLPIRFLCPPEATLIRLKPI